MDATIVNVALPVVIRDLDLTANQAEWMNAIYSLTFAALLLTVGHLGDLRGRRLLFAGGMVVFMLASVPVSYTHLDVYKRQAVTSVAQKILRRPYNYDDTPAAGSSAEAGLLFVAYQRDPLAQFVPMQERLAAKDLLNFWTTPIGSAVFAILPGPAEGETLGQALLG